jgi:hypothetical protein
VFKLHDEATLIDLARLQLKSPAFFWISNCNALRACNAKITNQFKNSCKQHQLLCLSFRTGVNLENIKHNGQPMISKLKDENPQRFPLIQSYQLPEEAAPRLNNGTYFIVPNDV